MDQARHPMPAGLRDLPRGTLEISRRSPQISPGPLETSVGTRLGLPGAPEYPEPPVQQNGRDVSPIKGDWRLTPDELLQAARVAEGAAGPDGWSAAEITHLPRTAWEIFLALWERWTARNQYPEAWRHIRMSMIPKVSHDGHINASDMRPISVQCVFSRLISTVIAKRQSTREWILQHGPAFSQRNTGKGARDRPPPAGTGLRKRRNPGGARPF